MGLAYVSISLTIFFLDMSFSEGENDWSKESFFPFDSENWKETSSIDDDVLHQLDEEATIFM